MSSQNLASVNTTQLCLSRALPFLTLHMVEIMGGGNERVLGKKRTPPPKFSVLSCRFSHPCLCLVLMTQGFVKGLFSLTLFWSRQQEKEETLPSSSNPSWKSEHMIVAVGRRQEPFLPHNSLYLHSGQHFVRLDHATQFNFPCNPWVWDAPQSHPQTPKISLFSFSKS